MWLGGALQMVAAFILLALCHYFAAGFLPVMDCDETFNFVEPIHQLLYGSGLQTWENCELYALRSWLFTWIYATPVFLVSWVPSLRNVDVYFFIRIFYGRMACLCELFFVYSVWAAFSGRTAVVTLVLLLLNYPIPHAGVSTLPTSFVMINYFMALGCWMRTHHHGSRNEGIGRVRGAATEGNENENRRSIGNDDSSVTAVDHVSTSRRVRTDSKRGSVFATVFFVVLACTVGWPFAGLAALPIAVDLLLHFPKTSVFSLLLSLALVVPLSVALDAQHYCRMTWSVWNLLRYNLLGGAERGPALYGVEPWYYFLKNLLLNAQLLFLAGLAAPIVILLQRLPPATHAAATMLPIAAGVHRTSRRGVVGSGGRAAGGGAAAAAEGRGTCSSSSSSSRPGGDGKAATAILRKRAPFLLSPADFIAPARSLLPSSSSQTVAAAESTTQQGPHSPPVSRGRALLYISPFFLWLTFWFTVPHKEERFMAPAYPFLVLAAALCFTQVFFSCSGPPQPPAAAAAAKSALLHGGWAKVNGLRPRRRRLASLHSSWCLPFLGTVLLLLFGALSFSRSMAVYQFYAGPQRLLYDNYAALQTAAAQKLALDRARSSSSADNSTSEQPYTLCMGREWYRFPSSFFLDPKHARIAFIKSPTFAGALPLPFARNDTTATCRCGSALVNDLNKAIEEQYVSDVAADCDAVLDTVSEFDEETGAAEYPRNVFVYPFATSQKLLDVDRTPMWCRVLYYPFGITERCAVWRRVELLNKHQVVASAAPAY